MNLTSTFLFQQKLKSWLPGLIRRHVIIIAIFFFIGFGFVFMKKVETGELHQCFIRAAGRLEAGQQIYRTEDRAYVYPPFMAMLAVPLTHATPRTALSIWYLINIAAALTVFICAWRLSGGPALSRLTGIWPAVFWLAIILSGRYFLEALKYQGFDVVIAALLFLGCTQLWYGHDRRGAVCLGMATAMKCTPLIFAPYLVWRGKFKTALILIAVSLIVNILPDMLWPQVNGQSHMAAWYSSFLSKAIGWAPGQWAPGQWFNGLLFNQSLAGLFNRFMRIGFPLSTAQLTNATAAELTGTQSLLLRGLVYGSEAVLLILTAWRFGKPWKGAVTITPQTPGPLSFEKLRMGLESGVIVSLMLLLSPMTDKSHYIVMILPCFLLARLFIEKRSGWIKLLMVMLLLSSMTAKDIIGKGLGNLMLAWGIPTWFVLLSLVGLFLAAQTRIQSKPLVPPDHNPAVADSPKRRKSQ